MMMIEINAQAAAAPLRAELMSWGASTMARFQTTPMMRWAREMKPGSPRTKEPFDAIWICFNQRDAMPKQPLDT